MWARHVPILSTQEVLVKEANMLTGYAKSGERKKILGEMRIWVRRCIGRQRNWNVKTAQPLMAMSDNETHQMSEWAQLTSRKWDQTAAPLTVSLSPLTHSVISSPTQQWISIWCCLSPLVARIASVIMYFLISDPACKTMRKPIQSTLSWKSERKSLWPTFTLFSLARNPSISVGTWSCSPILKTA